MGGRKPTSCGPATSPQHEAAEMSLEILISTAQAALRAQRLARRQGAALPECIGDDESIALTPQQSLTHLALHATRAVAAAATVCLPAFERASTTAPGLATSSTFPPSSSTRGTASSQGPSVRTLRRTTQRQNAKERAERRDPPATTGFFTTPSVLPTVVPGASFTFGNASGTVKSRDFAQTAAPSCGAAVSDSTFSDIVRRAPSGTPPSPGEKRSGKPASVPPSPPRTSKKGKAAAQGDLQDEDIADLEYEDPWHEADGLDVEVYDQHV
ncbi:hypothetical protein CYMTET_47357 [Cymbomonas tetramitiformis]|uniref:Uncharacterized protein n=1 Tax=Cymbomonas tetramitiformis TaxID=36881 RepID=A0AAE0BW62_9CHLO|nr:hypothetical protein CYMTET_47357 [Cymbomonas tetramitiformis]